MLRALGQSHQYGAEGSGYEDLILARSPCRRHRRMSGFVGATLFCSPADVPVVPERRSCTKGIIQFPRGYSFASLQCSYARAAVFVKGLLLPKLPSYVDPFYGEAVELMCLS